MPDTNITQTHKEAIDTIVSDFKEIHKEFNEKYWALKEKHGYSPDIVESTKSGWAFMLNYNYDLLLKTVK